MLKNALWLFGAFMLTVAAWNEAQARQIYVNGRANERSFCNANSGYFCLDNIKRRAESNSLREAQRACEFTYRGRALTYTGSASSFCNPSHLPVNHDGTWVSCNANASMQCEVN